MKKLGKFTYVVNIQYFEKFIEIELNCCEDYNAGLQNEKNETDKKCITEEKRKTRVKNGKLRMTLQQN